MYLTGSSSKDTFSENNGVLTLVFLYHYFIRLVLRVFEDSRLVAEDLPLNVFRVKLEALDSHILDGDLEA